MAQILKEKKPRESNIDIKEASASGIELIVEMMGYDAAIVVDAIATRGQIGTIHKLKPEELKETIHVTAPHLFNFASAYEWGKCFAPQEMPKKITIYGVEIEPKTDFTQNLTEKIAEAAQQIASEIIRDLDNSEQMNASAT